MYGLGAPIRLAQLCSLLPTTESQGIKEQVLKIPQRSKVTNLKCWTLHRITAPVSAKSKWQEKYINKKGRGWKNCR